MPTNRPQTTAPLLERPIPGVPIAVLETKPGWQVRVSAHAFTEGHTLVALRPWGMGDDSGEWQPRRGTLLFSLWQVEELIAALTEVAEAARDQGGKSRGR